MNYLSTKITYLQRVIFLRISLEMN